jgi:dTDP-4-dehydrorhamnose 3,5-epimerase
MEVKDSFNIEGVTLKKLNQFSDDRGDVLHMLKSSDDNFTKFGEIYFSEILPGKIKAWKYNKMQSQNLAVPIGIVKFIIFDNRSDSNSFGNIAEITLGRHNYSLLHLPAGLWYGFKSKCNYPSLIANCIESPYDANESIKKDYSDDFCPVNWNLV